MEDQEDWLVLFGVDLVLDVLLVLAQQFRVELDVAGLVHAMYIAEAGGDGEVWADGRERVIDVVDVLWLGVKGVVVDVLVVDPIFLTPGDTDFLCKTPSGLCAKTVGIYLLYHLQPLLHRRSSLQILRCGLDIPIDLLL